MAYRFNGSFPSEYTAPRGGAPANGGDITISALIRPTSGFFGLLEGKASGTRQWDVHADGGRWFSTNDFTSGFGTTNTNNWLHLGYIKAAGSHQVQWIQALHDGTNWGAYTDLTAGATESDGSTIDQIILGLSFATAAGDVAAAAMYATPMDKAGFAALGTSDMATWMAASPAAAWQCNGDPADDIVDLTGGGADLVHTGGTLPTVVADPPDWTYYDATPPEDHSGTAASAITLALAATGHPTHPGTAATALGLALAASGRKHARGTAALSLTLRLAAPAAARDIAVTAGQPRRLWTAGEARRRWAAQEPRR